jgi:hypothetical protein
MGLFFDGKMFDGKISDRRMFDGGAHRFEPVRRLTTDAAGIMATIGFI